MYLFIFEDGSLAKAATFCTDDDDSVDNGLLDIIDMETGLQRSCGGWSDIETIEPT
jgi:hypothetical protein